jgi:threonine/homoserine/homoserine lactone efflux protein
MAEAIGQVLSLGLGVSLSPVPIIAVVLMLATPRARSNGPAFVLGWIAGLVVVGSLVLALASGAGAEQGSDPATWVDVLKLGLGALLLLIAGRQWVKRPRDGAAAPLPAWMRTIDEFSPARSVALGSALSAVNPKNLLLTIGAAAAIAGSATSAGQEAVAFAVFVAVATLGPAAPVVVYFALGERAARSLDALKTFLSVHNAAIMAVLCLIIGAKLIGDGIAGLG